MLEGFVCCKDHPLPAPEWAGQTLLLAWKRPDGSVAGPITVTTDPGPMWSWVDVKSGWLDRSGWPANFKNPSYWWKKP